MVKRKDTVLSGMNEIAAYLKRSPTTVLHLIRTMGFPAKKIGGTWESDSLYVDKWREQMILRFTQSSSKNGIESHS